VPNIQGTALTFSFGCQSCLANRNAIWYTIKYDFSARRLHFHERKEKDPVGSYIRGADGGRDDRVRARQYRICGHVFRHRKSFPRVCGARCADDRRVPRNRGRHHPYAAARAGRARRLLDNGEDWAHRHLLFLHHAELHGRAARAGRLPAAR